MITEEASSLIKRVISQLGSIQHALSDRTVDVKNLVLLKKFKQHFLDLCSSLPNINKRNGSREMQEVRGVELVKRELTGRIDELQSFETLKDEILEFINICTASKNVGEFKFLE
jgi:hypothetical protein